MTTAIKERPILFTPAMAQAIADGRKTQTRRVVNWNADSYRKTTCGVGTSPGTWNFGGLLKVWPEGVGRAPEMYWERFVLECPYGVPGDRLWVRESFSFGKGWNGASPANVTEGEQVWYHADGTTRGGSQLPTSYGRVRPNIHMPRWACRSVLEVVSVRVERVQDIGKDGRKATSVLAEGITQEQIDHMAQFFHPDDSPALAYAQLWNEINGKGSWDLNPWVWVVEFRKVDP